MCPSSPNRFTQDVSVDGTNRVPKYHASEIKTTWNLQSISIFSRLSFLLIRFSLYRVECVAKLVLVIFELQNTQLDTYVNTRT